MTGSSYGPEVPVLPAFAVPDSCGGTCNKIAQVGRSVHVGRLPEIEADLVFGALPAPSSACAIPSTRDVAAQHVEEHFAGFLAMVPFFSTTIYTAPVAQSFGGADISAAIGLPVAGVVHYSLSRLLSRVPDTGEQDDANSAMEAPIQWQQRSATGQ